MNKKPRTAGAAPQENKMGVMPMNQLILDMSLPMMISMLVQALYNVVDSIFVSRISENALTALGLAFPMQNLMISVAVGTGVGVNALLSRSLGEKNKTLVEKSAENGIFLAVLNYLLFLLIGLFLVPVFFRSQTDVAEIVDAGIQYLTVCCCASFGLFGQIAFDRLLLSTGRTIYTMFTQGLGAVVNLILDPILIFGLLGFPKLGVTGAAVATVVGQVCAMSLSFFFCRTRNEEVPLHLRGFQPDGQVIRAIYVVGLPSIIMDLHASQIQGFFDIPVDNLLGNPIFVDYYAKKFGSDCENMMVVSPDVGSVSRARAFAQKLHMNLAIVDKRRQKANSCEVMNVIGDVEGMDCILFDDMVDTGGSLCNAAKALIDIGHAKSVHACASHGVLSGPAIERINNSVITELALLDTIPSIPADASEKIKYLTVAPLFAEAIERIYQEVSISKLFR